MSKETKNIQKNCSGSAKERKEQGKVDRKNGLSAKYPEDGYYMLGYNSKEKAKEVSNINMSIAAAEALAQSLSLVG